MNDIAPKISIIIPVYNVEKYIARCLDSLFNQNISENLYEIIVVNDGTPDSSMKIVSEYDRNHSNFIIINQKNRGVSAARNRGIEISKGEYLLFVDPDDYIVEDSLDTIISQSRICKVEILIFNSLTQFFNSKEKSFIFGFPQNLRDKTHSGIELSKEGYMRGPVWGIAFERQFIIKNNLRFFEGIINSEDSIFMSMCFIYSSQIKYFNLDYYIVCPRFEGATLSWDFNRVKNMLKNLAVIGYYVENSSLTNDQKGIIQKNIYTAISLMMKKLLSIHRLDKYFEIKQGIKKSGLYPITNYQGDQFKRKIHLLNISFDLFCFPFLIRQIYYDIKNLWHFVKTGQK
jgi:glycosyltransferase involved in cell wall biosynthesis